MPDFPTWLFIGCALRVASLFTIAFLTATLGDKNVFDHP